MAIQLPNPGLGDGQTGDNEYVMWTKVKDNFSNTTHAASKLVGEIAGQVPLVENVGKLSRVNPVSESITGSAVSNYDLDTQPVGEKWYIHKGVMNSPQIADYMCVKHEVTRSGNFRLQTATSALGATVGLAMRTRLTGLTSEWGGWTVFWSDKNTKLDTNGALAPSSPTIDLYNDRIKTNTDGARMNPEFVRNGVGDYTIKNTTGLRYNDGWYIKIPNDMNGNPKVAVAITTDKDGNLSIKTYKRTFSMETFTFGPDLENPLDIPEGRWIDLRFNDLPEEQLDEPIE